MRVDSIEILLYSYPSLRHIFTGIKVKKTVEKIIFGGH